MALNLDLNLDFSAVASKPDPYNEMQTNVAGVFAVGDLLCTHVKQAVIAASDGVIAAVAADKYVHSRSQLRMDWN